MGEKAAMEMKSVPKRERKVRILLNTDSPSASQNSSIGVVRWTLPEESVQAHSSAPSIPASSGPQRSGQNSLRDLRTLQECVDFIKHWKEQVDHVCKGCSDSEEGSSRKESRSLEESRKMILEWADELRHVDKLLKETSWTSVNKENASKRDKDGREETQLKITEWAKELQTASESCGMESEELGKALRLLGLKKKRLVRLLPLLEFITWSLLRGENTAMVSQLWLLAKQRTWKAGISRYIPNSVWSWISTAAVDVTLDPDTNHPWLQLSDDQRKVQEGLSESKLSSGSRRFDSWPCVLGSNGYSRGRHYWEVDIANNGYWRIGVTSADSKRQGRFPMTPREGYWVLWRSTHHFYACTQPETELPLGLVPRRVGIYLDYEEGQISFYNAESKCHIFTFTGYFRDSVHPLFAPMDGRTLMTVVEPQDISNNRRTQTD